jgi:hypothetical protein
MALPIDVTDPGNSNVETQAFGQGLAADVTPGAVVSEQFASASAVNLGFARVGPPPDFSVPGLGVRVDVDAGDDVAEQAVGATPLRNVNGSDFQPGLGVEVDSNDPGMVNVESLPVVGLGLPPLVQGGTFSPQRQTVEVTLNNVAGQVYGTGTPRNVNI